MSEQGIYSSRFEINNKSLKEFDDSLQAFRQGIKNELDMKRNAEKLLVVLQPLATVMTERLSNSMSISERNVLTALEKQFVEKHSSGIREYRQLVISLSQKIERGELNFNSKDFEILNDVADALDLECAYLFKRMG